MIELGPNRYGKSAIRLVKVIRDAERHTLRDLTVAIGLEGEFEAAHVAGDNANVVATDTMKNTVYAFAREYLTGSIERFGHVLARHFLAFPQVSRATISIDEHRWIRMPTDDGPAPDAFLRSGDYTRTATVSATADGDAVEAGIRDLVVMKTTRSAFRGFPRDEYTTLPEVDDRLLATRLTATWAYVETSGDFDAMFDAIGETLLDVFAEHHSPSVQASIWLVGRQILELHPQVAWIRMGSAQSSSLAGQPGAVRAGEPGRDLHSHHRAPRADRRDGPPRQLSPAGPVPAVGTSGPGRSAAGDLL